MKQSINFSQFHDAFRDHNRLDNFTTDGLRALFDWIEDLDDSCGTETELDVIALCCEFSAYGSALEIAADYGLLAIDPNEDQEAEAVDILQDHTTVITFNGGIIIQDF